MSSPSKPVPPGTPPPSPPPGGPTRPTPVAPPKHGDDLLDLADAVGITTPARRDATGAGSAIPPVAVKETGGPVSVPGVLGRDEGRADGAVGAATFTLPPTPEPPYFALPPGAMEMGRRFPGDTAKFVGPKP